MFYLEQRKNRDGSYRGIKHHVLLRTKEESRWVIPRYKTSCFYLEQRKNRDGSYRDIKHHVFT